MSIKLSSIILFFLFPLTTILAQNIKVLDKETKEPVSGVAIFNLNKTTTGYTDFDGYVDISRVNAGWQ